MATRRLLMLAKRAILASPFLAITWLCFTQMDFAKLGEHPQAALRFYGVAAVDKTFRGVTVTFSPSALGYDPVSAWQMLSFLTDLGPVYAVWTLESCRAGKACATFWTTLSQLVGIGSAGPPADFALLLPLILALHNAEVLAAYVAPDLATRHYWTWAWQLSPTWIGLANSVGAHTVVPLLRRRFAGSKASSSLLLPSSPRTVLAGVGLVAAGFDELCSFVAGFLWLAYSVGDLYAAGLIKGGLDLVPLALLLIIGAKRAA
ncbi:hypothetical protein B0T24DRAFT_683033 [Lasiosphaeria ovina]|uniref:Uncharacterized protein n=1 Tax=Lasiosphaeria ovina TaxID=92902 RepID=A0AAE0JX47_9PEZI|nr:hypothetical protein B0T24DRAFT_683033 [Lasiosphaeria ovina]